MTTWQQIHNNKFIIRSKDKVITVDTVRSLIAYSMAFGLDFDDIEYARLEMERNDHDYAEFGIFGGLLFTKRTNDETAH